MLRLLQVGKTVALSRIPGAAVDLQANYPA
jgi:hypothetical protein